MLESRSRLGSYEIVSLLGRGGMGEVCRARDLKLNRNVAIKVLPDQLSQDSERLGRLRREVQVVAALTPRSIRCCRLVKEDVIAPVHTSWQIKVVNSAPE